MNIHFEKATLKHHDRIFSWLKEPHMVEFWDNSQEHRDDILNFMQGRKEPAHYFNGIFSYWVGYLNNQAYAFILSAEAKADEDSFELWNANLSKTGRTYSIDFGIGNPEFIGKGLAAPTLEAFVKFYHDRIDSSADTFFIDPDLNNPRAFHVYEKAGFKSVGQYDVKSGAFTGEKSHLMVKKI
jgi:RimJ/RimL family protein N-acetyltransferase